MCFYPHSNILHDMSLDQLKDRPQPSPAIFEPELLLSLQNKSVESNMHLLCLFFLVQQTLNLCSNSWASLALGSVCSCCCTLNIRSQKQFSQSSSIGQCCVVQRLQEAILNTYIPPHWKAHRQIQGFFSPFFKDMRHIKYLSRLVLKSTSQSLIGCI